MSGAYDRPRAGQGANPVRAGRAAVAGMMPGPAWLGGLFGGLCALVLALVFFQGVIDRPLWTDEVFSLFEVQGKTLAAVFDSLALGVNALPAGYVMLLWLLDRLAGLDALVLRLPSLLCGALSVVLLLRLQRGHFAQGAICMGCALALFLSGEFLYFVQEGRPYTLYTLTAVLALAAGAAVLGRARAGRAALVLNALTAFALPASHFVGLLYSAALALAVLWLARGLMPPAYRWRVAGSFIAGWAAFAALHAWQIAIALRGEGLIDPGWLQPPTAAQLFAVAARYGAPLLLMALLLRRAPPGVDGGAGGTGGDRVSRLLCAVALLWLALPLLFFTLAALDLPGLPNLALARYWLPSDLGLAIAGAWLLDWLARRLPAGRPGRLQQGLTLGACLVVLSLSLPALRALQPEAGQGLQGIYWRLDSALRNGPSWQFEQALGTGQPLVSNNIHIYFPMAYYFGSRSSVSLLRADAAEAARLERWHPAMRAVAPETLAGLGNFHYLHAPGTLNSMPHFDLRRWAASRGCRVSAGVPGEGYRMFDVRCAPAAP